MAVDERGIPVERDDSGNASFCPDKPCELCTGFSSIRKADGTLETSYEWCTEMKTCAATVDWDEVFDHG